MNRTMLTTIVVLALGMMVCTGRLAGAVDMGTAFTYQGRLLVDANDVNDVKVPANGLYDFQFKLYDGPDPNFALQVGITVDINDVNLAGTDGYFTVELDFVGDDDPNVFNGYARWLEIGIRPGELEDPSEYTFLSPVQELTPTPYAIYAENAGMLDGRDPNYYSGPDNDWNVVGSRMHSIPSGNVGIGTTSPSEKLDVDGQIRIRGGSPGAGKVLTSVDSSGRARWEEPDDGGADNDWMVSGNDMHSIPSGNVGVGTTSPSAKLHVLGGRLRINTAPIGGYAAEIDGNRITGECQGCPPGEDRLHLGVADNQGNVLMVEDGGGKAIEIKNKNTTSGAQAVVIKNHSRGSALDIRQNYTELPAGQHGLYVMSYVAQTKSPLVYFHQKDSGSSTPCLTLNNDGSGYDMYEETHKAYLHDGTWTNASCFSWLKQNRAILARDETLDILSSTDIEKFKMKSQVEKFGENAADTEIGIVLDEAHPALSSKNEEGEITGYSPMRTASVAFRGVQISLEEIDNLKDEIAKLRAENDSLKERLEALERMVGQQQVASAKEVQQ